MGGRAAPRAALRGRLRGPARPTLAKAMAAEANVPFLFVSGTAFQSMFTAPQPERSAAYFRALRKAAPQEGGAIGFIEEIDAIGRPAAAVATTAPRGRHRSRRLGCGGLRGAAGAGLARPSRGRPRIRVTAVAARAGGVVNELLVQMQSFDEPSGLAEGPRPAVADGVNLLLPPHRQMPRPRPQPAEHPARRGDQPGRLRWTRPCCGPGGSTAGSPSTLPAKAARRAADRPLPRPQGARRRSWTTPSAGTPSPAITQGYTPGDARAAARRGARPGAAPAARTAMRWTDVEQARLLTEVGLGQPVAYTDHEERLIATHEAARRGRLARGTAATARGADDRQARGQAWACWRTATARTSTPALARSCWR